MQVSQQLRDTSRQFIIAGVIALGIGGFFVVDDWRNGRMTAGSLGTILLIALAILGGMYLYQSTMQWRVLRQRLMNADFAKTPPTNAYKPMPIWLKVLLWSVWVLLMFGFAVSFNGAFAMFFGSFILAYGIANPKLARAVQNLEAGRVIFYATRDQNRRPKIVRVMPDSES